jgi:LAO/AO transport system kinase
VFNLIENIRKLDKLAIARAISIVENNSSKSHQLLKSLFKHTGKAYLIGITGPPGAGKSTITNYLTKSLRQQEYSIGIIAVDPTSPFTGGAVLGDRIRMNEIGLDDGVFIRSMATRGSLGGLAAKAKEACEILDAAGMDFIIIETVGVGQSELDIANTADTTVVVLVPESGDAVQTMKAGLMEIGDVFVVNKSDREGADVLASALRTMLHLKNRPPVASGIRADIINWEPPVVKTIATKNEGIERLLKVITNHRNFLETNDLLAAKRKEHITTQIYELVSSRLESNFWSEQRKSELEKNLDKILNRELNPYDFVEILLSFRAERRIP